MDVAYNPFTKKETIDTPKGMINYQHEMGKTYVTHRRKEHKIENTFLIETTELRICHELNIEWVLIIYKDKETTKVYRTKMRTIHKHERYKTKNQTYIQIPIEHMEEKKEQGWT